MNLGAFSVSLTVKDLAASKAFYEKLGFEVFGGSMEHNYLMMKSPTATIGLFHGMFDYNILTFNPGWDENGQPVGDFADVREIQKQIKAADIPLEEAADESTTGPAHLVIVDPDGNPILIDQHV